MDVAESAVAWPRTLVGQVGSLPVTDDGRAPALPAACYTDPAFFAFERDHIIPRHWTCLGHIDQLARPGDYLYGEIGRDPVMVVRAGDGRLRAMSALCRHRGHPLVTASGHTARGFRCPLHSWTYNTEGRLIGAPRMGRAETVRALTECTALPTLPMTVWHGFVFVSLAPGAPPLEEGLAKLEAAWQGYEEADLVAVPPALSDKPLPWNWKVHVENFTDAYHPEYVHQGTHDFAPSAMRDDGVEFTAMEPGDQCIVRSVPLIEPDGGMTRDGWGKPAEFPPIETLTPTQRRRLTFALIPPSLTLIFAPTHIGYALLRPIGAEATLAANDRVTGGGWLVPRGTRALADFDERAARIREGGAKIWAQDVPVNTGMQAAKHARFLPVSQYGPLERTLEQFNAWMVYAVRATLSDL